MRGQDKYAFSAYMVRNDDNGHHHDSCRVGDLFQTREQAVKAIEATHGWHIQQFTEMAIYRNRVSRAKWQSLAR